ncbi:MAG: hypothetical protein MJ187_03605 [Alphaproteobacteria bacterium]|nr:hypothetical protein [Alphaproteobacteria bacterium]
MNILIHYYRLGHYIGGAEVVALNQCSEILRQGHNVTILTADTGHHSKIFDEFLLENNPKIKLVELILNNSQKIYVAPNATKHLAESPLASVSQHGVEKAGLNAQQMLKSLESHSPVIKDVIWSMSVQHGMAKKVVKDALGTQNIATMTDADIINKMYDARIYHINHRTKMSANEKQKLLDRYTEERAKALEQLK